MSPLQKVIFLVGVAAVIALGNTLLVLSVERVFPNYPGLTIVGPALCIVSALLFCKWYYGRLW